MVIKNPKHLAYTLSVKQKEIERIIANIDNFYTEYTQPKKKGVRIINPSHRRLKVIQERIQKRILEELDLPDYVYGARKGRDNVENASKHKGKRYKFATDLRKFFPSIDHHQVNRMFLSRGFSPTVSHILTLLTTYKGRLPQGAPTSSTMANLVFVNTGNRLNEFAIMHKLTFTTFVDDLAFSSQFDFKDKVEQILEIITHDGYKISHEKTHYSHGPKITGLHPRTNTIRHSDEFKEKLSHIDEMDEEQKRGIDQYRVKVQKANSKTTKNS